jgi:hypothetical protein
METRRWRRRRRDPVVAHEALAHALDDLGLTDQAHRLRIILAWPQAVGPRIAGSTTPSMFSRGVLTVRAHTASWQQELTYLKSELVTRLNDALGRKVVTEIKVIAGNPPVRPPKRTAVEPDADDVAAAERVASEIEDPEVRACFAKLLARDRAHFKAHPPKPEPKG